MKGEEMMGLRDSNMCFFFQSTSFLKQCVPFSLPGIG